MALRDRNRGRPARHPRRLDGPTNSRLFVLFGTIAILLAGLVWLNWKSQLLHVETDRETLCPLKTAPSEALVLLLDVSDQLSEPQLLKIENEVERLRDTLPRWGLIETYVVARDGERVTTPAIRLCNPGTGADMNRVYQSPDLAAKRWKEFAMTLRDRITALMQLPEVGSSPIFESIQAISLRTFDRPEMDRVPKRLVVVSDLMQNVPGAMSHYQGVPDFKAFLASPYFSRVRADLDGVDVTLLYLDRSNTSIQGMAHVEFWTHYFEVQGATVHEVQKIFGDQ